MFRDQGFRKSAPIEEGEELEVTIEAVGEKGDGIAKAKGFVIFVPGVKEGEHVKVRVTKVLRNFGFGEVIGAATGGAKEAKEKVPAAEGEEGDDSDDNGDDSDEDEDEAEEKSESSEAKDSEEF